MLIAHQAPIRGKSRARAPTSYPSRAETFSNTKSDKRSIKHSLLLSKIKSSGSSDQNRVKKSSEKSSNKRRRPQKKLTATLDSLADALPDFDDEDVVEYDAATVRKSKSSAEKAQTTNKSLSSRPGIMKRKAKIEALERERFGMNIAMMSGSTGANSKLTAAKSGDATKTSGGFGDRWAALKAHVQENMEKKAEFMEK